MIIGDHASSLSVALFRDTLNWRSDPIGASAAFTEHLLGLRSNGLTTQDINPNSRSDKIRINSCGVPGTVKLVPAEDVTGKLWRHYTTVEAKTKILDSSRLIAGGTPYVIVSGHYYKEWFPDLTGVFLTLENFDAKSVGVTEYQSVDVRLLPGTGLLMIEAGIFLVPGPRGFELPLSHD